jgi:hypothetical protein
MSTPTAEGIKEMRFGELKLIIERIITHNRMILLNDIQISQEHMCQGNFGKEKKILLLLNTV